MMKINRQLIRKILREAVSLQEAQAFNRMLSSVLSDITEEAIPFGNDPEVDAALGDIESAMLRLKKATIASTKGAPLREHVTDEHHEHPHEHSRVMVPQVNNKDEAEDLLHDTFLAVEEHLSLEEIESIIAMLY